MPYESRPLPPGEYGCNPRAHNTGRDSWPPEREARVAKVEARALEVFGNQLDAAVWKSKFDCRIGPLQIRDEIFGSDAGACAALAVLDELAKTVVPRAHEIPKYRPRRRR